MATDTAATRTQPPDRRVDEGEPFLRQHPWLIAIAVLLPMVEVAVLRLVGLPGQAAIAPHVTATAPFGVLHDLRWLLAYHTGWWVLAGGVAGMLVFRGGLLALMIRAAWPTRGDRPGWGVALRSTVPFTLGAAIVMSPWVALLFAAQVTSLSWFWFAGAGAAILTAALIHRGAIAGRWWRLPTWRTFGRALLTALVLTLASAAIALGPAWSDYLAAGLAGLYHAWAWLGYVRSAVISGEDRPIHQWAAVIVVLLIAGVVWGSGMLFGRQTGRQTAAGAGAALEGDGRPVLVARGYGSSWHGQPVDLLPPPFSEVIFSYRGIGPDGDPLPYPPEATDESIFELASIMRDQVEALHERTGQPVAIVADSEGTLVTQAYLAAAERAPVSHVVLASPLVHPGREYYATPGRDGWNVATAWELRGILWVTNRTSTFDVDIDSAFARSLVERAPATRNLPLCRMGVDTTLVLPLASAAVFPLDADTDLPTRWVPATHANILQESGVNRLIQRALAGRPLDDGGLWGGLATAIRAGAAGWAAPPLDLHLPAVWADTVPAGAEQVSCDRVRELTGRYVGP